MPSPLERALDLLRRAPLVDGHNDLLWEARLRVGYDFDRLDVGRPQPELMTDIPRLRAGGVGGQFWSVYVSSAMPGATAVTATLEQLDGFHALLRRYPDDLAQAVTADDVEAAVTDGRIASMAGVEGGHSIGGSMGALRMLRGLGAAYMTLTHNDTIAWADSATDEPLHGGLTRFGEEVVREMNRLGMLVDCSHVSPDTMRQAIDVSEAPVIFSHSNARAVADVPRNVPDDVLRKVAETGGVVMVTFVPMFLTPAGAEMSAKGWEEARRLKALHPDDPELADERWMDWMREQPGVTTTVGDVADHVDHIRDVAGIDHIGVGSDFDGMPSAPEGLEDVAAYPALFAELIRRGYDDEALARISRGNVLRVMRQAEVVADQARRERPPSLARIEELDG